MIMNKYINLCTIFFFKYIIYISQAKRVVLYLARSRPERLLDEMMTELQTVETLNCLIERTETPPFYRLTSMRKATSGHSDGPGTGSQVCKICVFFFFFEITLVQVSLFKAKYYLLSGFRLDNGIQFLLKNLG